MSLHPNVCAQHGQLRCSICVEAMRDFSLHCTTVAVREELQVSGASPPQSHSQHPLSSLVNRAAALEKPGMNFFLV